MSEATHLLVDALQLKKGQSALLAIDENTRLNAIEKLARLGASLHVHTNRYELARLCQRKGFDIVRFSDFDFSEYADASLDVFAHRVGKDKALTHFLINQAKRLLKPGGKLILSGMRQEGTKTYGAKSTEILGGPAETKTKRSGARVVCISKASSIDDAILDDKDYSRSREIKLDTGTVLLSKPGIFGWNKIDQGSKFLVENAERLDGKSFLDLGCGFGYLAFHAHQNGARRIVATDNNAAALKVCSENLKTLGAHFETIASDAGNEIEESFDAIWCNPPFHQGVKANLGLSAKFVRALARLLKPNGYALVVVNGFIPFEKLAAEHFANIREIASSKSFKLLKLEN